MDGKNSQLFDRAVSALASVFVGKKVGDDRLVHHGVMLYNSAIQVFSRLISKTGLPIQEVLSANVVFQLYEVGFCPPIISYDLLIITGHPFHVRIHGVDGAYARCQCRRG